MLFGRAQVERINGLKISVYANEPPPPHFHVLGPEINATFSIETYGHLTGEISRKNYDVLVWWHKRQGVSL
jgi:hypothetical protein